KDAVIPKYAHSTDAGLDITATTKSYDQDGNVIYGSGLSIEIPSGYAGLLFPRSSNSKKDMLLSNSVGIIDSGYRGELIFKFKKNINTERSTLNTMVAVSLIFDMKDEFKQLGSLDGDDSEEYSEYNVGDRVGQL